MNRSLDFSPAKIAGLLALTFVILGAATWLLLIQPKQSTANNLDSTIASTQAQLAKQTTTHTPSAKATHKHTLSQTVISARALPNLVAMPQILFQLSRIANEEHVTLVSIVPLATVPYANYEALPMTVTLAGKFFGIQGFLQQLRNQVRSSSQAGLAATGRLYDVAGRHAHRGHAGAEGLRDPDARRLQLHGLRVRDPWRGDDDKRDPDVGAVMAAKANGKARRQNDDAGAAKKRSQLIVIAVGGVLLVALVGYQLPGLLGSSSPSGTADAATTPPPAVPVTKTAAGTGSSSPVPAWIRVLGERDVFVPQVVVSTAGATAASAAVTPSPPPVRATGWVVKDPFVPQVGLPTAAAPTVTTPTPITRHVAPVPSPQSGGYIVVLEVISGSAVASEKAAAHEVVAAKNAGLRDVVANDAIPGTTRMGTHFTVYTGPYPSAAVAQPELVRALRNGYPTAHTQRLPASAGKGF